MNKDTAVKTITIGSGRTRKVITIDSEFESLIPPLSANEYALLKDSIRKDGVRDPLIVWANYPVNDAGLTTGEKPALILLDGHNRARIWQELETEEPDVLEPLRYEPIPCITREGALLWIEENQAGRRNLNDDQRAVIWDSIRERRSAIRRAEQLAAARQSEPVSSETDDTEPDPPGPEPTQPKQDTRKEVAREAKIPENKLKTVAALKKTNPDAVKEVRAGKKTLRQANAEAKAAVPKPASTETTPAEVADDLARFIDKSIRPLSPDEAAEVYRLLIANLQERLAVEQIGAPESATAVPIIETVPAPVAHPLPPYLRQVMRMLQDYYCRETWQITPYEAWTIDDGNRTYDTEGRARSAIAGIKREHGASAVEGMTPTHCDFWRVGNALTVADRFESKADAETAIRYVDEEMTLRKTGVGA